MLDDNWPLDDDPRGIPSVARGSLGSAARDFTNGLMENLPIAYWNHLESTLNFGICSMFGFCDQWFLISCWCNSRFCLHFLSPFMSLKSPNSTWWCPRNPQDFIWPFSDRPAVRPKSLLKVPLINRYITTLKGIISYYIQLMGIN